MNDDKNNNDNWLNDLKQGGDEVETPNTTDDYLDSLENTDSQNQSDESSYSNEAFSPLPNQFEEDKGIAPSNNFNQFMDDDNQDDFIPQKQILTTPEKKTSVPKAILGAIVLGGIISIAYIGFSSDGEKPAEVITVQQTAPLKEQPVDPEGMEIKDQDKEVFGVLTEEVEGENVERLLPIPEKPIISKKQVDKAKKQKAPEKEEKYTVEIDGVEQTEKTQEQKTVKQQPKKAEVKKQEPKKVEKLSSWKVQIASVGSNAKAKATFNKVAKKIPAVAKYKLFIETAKVNGKDYHRVQIVGFKDKAEALAICNTIKSKGGDCLVKK